MAATTRTLPAGWQQWDDVVEIGMYEWTEGEVIRFNRAECVVVEIIETDRTTGAEEERMGNGCYGEGRVWVTYILRPATDTDIAEWNSLLETARGVNRFAEESE